MDSRLLITIIGLPIYLFLLIYFRRYRQWLLYYLVGAFGLTMLIALPVEYLKWDYYLIAVESFHANLLGSLIGISSDLLEHGRILLQTNSGSSILQIGIECSGVLEAGVLIGLVSFYPVFRPRSKVLKIAFGLAVTYLINILRLLIIIVVVAKFGTGYIFIAHAVIARLFFFSLAIALYWYILTKPTLKVVGEATKERKLAFDIHHRPDRARVIRKGVKITSTLIIALLFAGSFALSSDWHKAFGPVAGLPDRPFIYSDQTGIETLGENGQVLGATDNQQDSENEQILADFFFENVLGNEQRTYKYKVLETGEFNIRLVQGTEPVYVEIYKNGRLQNISNLDLPEAGLILDQNVFYMLTNAGPGDTLEIKLKNKGKSKADYVAEVISEGVNGDQVANESTKTPATTENHGDYCNAGLKRADVIPSVDTKANKTVTKEIAPATRPIAIHAPVAPADNQKLAADKGDQTEGKVLGVSTGTDPYSDLQKNNSQLQLENILLTILTTILGAISLILVAIIVYLLKRKARSKAEIISEKLR